MVARQALTTRDFLHEVQQATLDAIDPSLGSPTAKRVFSSLQIHFGEPRLHYEVWPVRKTGRIEIGLHIEGPQEWSRQVAAQIAGLADDLRAALGPDYELEDWTASWCRLHTTLPLTPLTDDLASQVAGATVALIQAAEPLLHDLDLPPLGPAVEQSPSERRHWRRKRRG